ncbi:MAG: hypothetical protein KAT15_22310 [Bacteroidales bacterium]|nr:hypothetical protein [Bacteroidales bacterium]
MTKLRIIFALAGLAILTQSLDAQHGSFLDHLRIGFGAGANTSHIIDLQPYNVFEDLTGTEYENSYTGLLQNTSNQYFVQAEWYNDFLVIALKPGTYSHRFSKINEVVFTNETVEQVTPTLLRYLSVPVEIRYSMDFQRFRPYAGLTVAYSHLLGSNDASNHTFIRPKITAGGVAGTYIDLRYIILDLNVGYHAGVHNIASKSERFEAGSGNTFAQNDILLNNLQVSLSILFSLQKQKHYSNVECFY